MCVSTLILTLSNLHSLGLPGNPGEQGVTGSKGDTGKDGDDGKKGEIGLQGPQVYSLLNQKPIRFLNVV